MSKVYLVGAGPGDIGLITLKALRALQTSDVIFYDRLVNKDILNYTRKDAELIYVGKENGYHSIEQDEINQMILHYAKNGFIVSRLKSGDPFVFGRGAEEAIFLKENGIDFEIIPGVSSAIAVPAHAYIPLTHREVSSSFAVITGHKLNGGLNHIKWDKIVGIDTLVFLMGVSSRQEIAKHLIKAGRDENESVAFIEDGFGPNEKTIITTLKMLAISYVEVSSPAVMVVGDVVNLRQRLESKEIVLCKI